MANIDLHAAGIDFVYVLLDHYHQFGLNENDLAVILMSDHLLRKGEHLITSDLLSIKMSIPAPDIDKILSKLVKNGFLAYETGEEGMITSLSPLKEKLYQAFERTLAKDRSSLHSEERASALSRLYDYFEKWLNRDLSPVENELIGTWLDAGYGEEDIRHALEEALNSRKRSLKAVDKVLRTARAREDIAKEGYTGISPEWSEDIERTIEIAKTRWIDEDEEDEGD